MQILLPLAGEKGARVAMPLTAIIAALSAAVIHASWNAALKGGRDRVTDSFLVGVGGIVLALAMIAVLGLPPAAAWPFLILSGALHVLYWFALMKAYDVGDLSHVYTLARGSAPLLVAIGAGLVAREIPAPIEMGGIALISAGVLAIGISPHARLRATLWAMSLGAIIATYSLADALGARAAGSAPTYIAWCTVLMSAPLMLFALVRRGPARLMRDVRVDPWRGLIVGVVSMVGYGLVLWAQTMAPIAQVTALRETSVVFAALIAWLFMGERVGARRWLGAALAASGAALLAFG